MYRYSRLKGIGEALLSDSKSLPGIDFSIAAIFQIGISPS